MNKVVTALPKTPNRMSVTEFLIWDAPPNQLWQLVDGEPQAMAPGSRTHGAIQSQLAYLITRHLEERASPCSVITAPGIIPRVNANKNFRIPDLAVTCTGYEVEETAITGPVLLIEILSPSNKAETWANIWTYTTIPTVTEILIVKSEEIGAELLPRNGDGTWPSAPELIEQTGEVKLASIGFTFPLIKAYRTTRLAAV